MSEPWSRIPITWLMLTHRVGRLILSILGIAFAVLLMFMQLGFLTGLFDSQSLAIRKLRADILIMSWTRHNFHAEESFPAARLRQARDIPGVARTTGITIDNALWRNPNNGSQHVIRLIGVDPLQPVFDLPEFDRWAGQLRQPRSILYDVGSRAFIGKPALGQDVEVSGKQVRVVGLFDLGADFKNDGSLVASHNTVRELLPQTDPDEVSIGLIAVEPASQLIDVARKLREILPNDVVVHTRDEYDRIERDFWARMTPTGFVFTLGLIVGFIIGVMICYQILYNEINDHLPQFATLKAIGFSDRYLVGVVLKEAVLLAILGLVPGILASQLFYSAMIRFSGLHMELTPTRIGLVAALTLVMCVVSAVLAVVRILKTDPAEVF
jgi:putative ABC transport system permease protein